MQLGLAAIKRRSGALNSTASKSLGSSPPKAIVASHDTDQIAVLLFPTARSFALSISVIRTTACTTTYRVDNDIVQLWIIVGGTPCLDFDYGGLSRRFPVIAMWDDRHLLCNRYRHQDPRNIVDPKAEDVLPNGLTDLEDWYKVNKPLKDLRDCRYEKIVDLIGGTNIRSRRCYDRIDGCYFRATWQLYNRNCVCTVHGDSKICNCHSLEYAPVPWQNLAAVLKEEHDLWETWFGMAEVRFQKILAALARVTPIKAAMRLLHPRQRNPHHDR